jgi:TniQ
MATVSTKSADKDGYTRLRPCWAFARPPARDESLTSWLIANARRHGGQLHTFTAMSFGQTQIWHRDSDLHPRADVIVRASVLAGVRRTDVDALTLVAEVSRVAESARGYVPWLLPVGNAPGSPATYGTQYCPVCLSESPYWRRHWRWSFLTTCDLHEDIAMADSCPHCSAPVIPHRSPKCDMTRCHKCQGSLIDVPGGDCGHTIAQEWLLAVVQHSATDLTPFQQPFPSQVDASRALLAGVRHLLGVLLSQAGRRGLARLGYSLPVGNRAFEHTRRTDRHALLTILGRALFDGETGLATFLNQLFLTQRSFVGHSFPDWMNRAIQTLPPGRISPHRRHAVDLLTWIRVLRRHYRHDRSAFLAARERAILDAARKVAARG